MRPSVAIARFDSLPTETNSYVISKMFGQNVAFPFSLIKLAQLSDAVIIPVFVIRQGKLFITKFGEPVEIPTKAGPNGYVQIAANIGMQVENEIIANAQMYTSWNGIYEKMRMAHELIKN